MPQQAPCGIFIFVQTQARAALKHQCLSERRIKPPAGTLQAEGKGAGFKKQPHLPRRAALLMDTGCSRHREERPGEEVEGLGAGWMLTAPGPLPPSVLEIKTQS